MKHRKLNIVLVAILGFFTTVYVYGQTEIDDLLWGEHQLGEVKIVADYDEPTIQLENVGINNQYDPAEMISMHPGVNLVNFGGRAETSITMRGFDIRSIPVYYDGIPVYVPYDGYIDLGNLSTSSISGISIIKGFTPGGLTANSMGGAINFVSRKPKKGIEADVNLGFGSGKYKNRDFYLGSKIGKFYISGAISSVRRNYYPLSNDFDTTGIIGSEDGDRRDNSDYKKIGTAVKIGYQPNTSDEYSLNYMHSNVSKSTPTYAGHDEFQRERFWKWPYWKKNSVYFLGRKRIGTNTLLKFRAYYDDFSNKLQSFDDNSYNSQTRRYAFTSYYNDYSLGANADYAINFPSKNLMRLNFQLKDDHHSEYNEGEKPRDFRDLSYYAGLEDAFKITRTLKIIGAVGYTGRNGILAEDYNSNDSTISDFETSEAGGPTLQVSLQYEPIRNQIFKLGAYSKTRLSTMKERYSYRAGFGIPNPYLKPEDANQVEFSYRGHFTHRFSINGSVFYTSLENALAEDFDPETGLSQIVNRAEAENYGFELAATLKLTSKIELGSNYAYIKMKNLTDPDIYFTHIPENEARLYLKLKPLRSVSINTDFIYMSDRYSTDYGTIADAFSIFNLGIAYEPISFFKVDFSIENLFDTNYQIAEGYPEPGRMFFVNIHLDI